MGCVILCVTGGVLHPMRATRSNTVRRSVALSRQLLEEARGVAPKELRSNWNRLVVVALQEFVARRRQQNFEESMARMAADPQIRKECRFIAAEFAGAERDGLRSD